MEAIHLSAGSDFNNRAQAYKAWRAEITQLESVIDPVFEEFPKAQPKLNATIEGLKAALNTGQGVPEARANDLLDAIKAWQSLSPQIAEIDPSYIESQSPESLLRRKAAQASPSKYILDLIKRTGMDTGLSGGVKNVGFTASATINDTLKAEIEGLIRGFLENGIEDMSEFRNIMILAGALGMNISPTLLTQIKEGVHDYIEMLAGSTTNMKDFLSTLSLIQSMSSTSIGEPVVNKEDVLSRHFQSQLQIATKSEKPLILDADDTDPTATPHAPDTDDSATAESSKPSLSALSSLANAAKKHLKEMLVTDASTVKVEQGISAPTSAGFSSNSDSRDQKESEATFAEIKKSLNALLEKQIEDIAGQLFTEITQFMYKQLDRQADEILDKTPFFESNPFHDPRIV
jgi:hypothetical protein